MTGECDREVESKKCITIYLYLLIPFKFSHPSNLNYVNSTYFTHSAFSCRDCHRAQRTQTILSYDRNMIEPSIVLDLLLESPDNVT